MLTDKQVKKVLGEIKEKYITIPEYARKKGVTRNWIYNKIRYKDSDVSSEEIWVPVKRIMIKK